MKKCCMCGKKFNVSDAREEYNGEFAELGDIDYDEQYDVGAVCADCAISDTQSNMDLGKAINMWNGEEDFDADHVKKYF